MGFFTYFTICRGSQSIWVVAELGKSSSFAGASSPQYPPGHSGGFGKVMTLTISVSVG